MGTRTASHYRILGELGSGGMSVVYAAEDMRLGRRVALKFLPDHLAENSELLERLAREARTASALNHPNICTLYDIDEHEGKPFLVMELLEGESLKDRLARGLLPLPSLLDWGIQIADALEAAHSQGIIHRDIKPANLFITLRNQIKVLDFGLAKPVKKRQPAGAPDVDVTQTLWGNFESTPGSAAGTIGYMSPEQARGEVLDGRSDLFSFGAVLYQMITAHEPFPGATSAIVFDAILNRNPEPAHHLNPAVPPELERVVQKALEKDPNMRYQTAADVGADLQRIRRDSTAGSHPTAPGPTARSSRRAAKAVLAALAVILAAGLVWWLDGMFRRPAPPAPVKITANPSDLPVHMMALSRDGKYLAYSDRLGIHIRAWATGDSRTLPDTAGMLAVDWSRDSTELYAIRMLSANDFSVWTVPLLGGTPRAGPPGLPSPDGRYLCTPRGIAAADGGSVWPHGVSVEQTTGFAWSPDSRHSALARFESGAVPVYSIEVSDMVSHQVRTLVRSELPIVGVAWLSDTRLVFGRMEHEAPLGDFNLWTADLNPLPGSRQPARWTQWSGFHIRWLSATADGKRVAFRQEDSQTDVYVARLEAGGTHMTVPERITWDDHADSATDWMPGDRAVLFESDRSGEVHIYRQAIDSPDAELFVGGPGQQVGARISPDDRWLLYFHLQGGKMGDKAHRAAHLLRMPLAGGTSEEVLATEGTVRSFQCSRRPGGACVLTEMRGNDLVVSSFDVMGGRGREIVRPPRAAGDAAISPDGAHIAIAVGEPRTQIRVYTIDGKLEQEIPVSGATHIVGLDWSADGRSFFCGDVTMNNSSIRRVERDGSSQVLWWQLGHHDIWAIPSRDGRYLALHGATESANVWAFETR